MKVGEIKLEALRLMNESGYQNLTFDNFETYLKETRFKKYLFNMNNSINRAIDYMNGFCILKSKSVFLNNYLIEKTSTYSVFDLSKIPDLAFFANDILLH